MSFIGVVILVVIAFGLGMAVGIHLLEKGSR